MLKYVYAMMERPPGLGAQPMYGLIDVDGTEQETEGRMCWGTATYDRELLHEEERHYSMKLLKIVMTDEIPWMN